MDQMVKCYLCKGTIKSGCICITTAKEIFPDIEESYKKDSCERNITFEELKKLKYGDEIILDDPMVNGAAYVYMNGTEKDYYFVSNSGASFLIRDEETIKGFGVKLIDNSHPNWDQELSQYGINLASALNIFTDMDDLKDGLKGLEL